MQFLSTLSVRRATIIEELWNAGHAISIHALREESDLGAGYQGFHRQRISIHALREESDVKQLVSADDIRRFLSTLSVRRATKFRGWVCRTMRFLSTLSVRRATVSAWL